jgi:hypothetical protein
MDVIDIICAYDSGDETLQETLIQLEEARNEFELSLSRISNFKQENSGEIASLSTEFKEGYKGFTFEVRQGSKRFSYKGIPEWEATNNKRKEVENKYKSMFLAKVAGNPHANISEDGEELPLPEISYGKPSVIIKKKK